MKTRDDDPTPPRPTLELLSPPPPLPERPPWKPPPHKKTRKDRIIHYAVGIALEDAYEAGTIVYSPRCTLLATLPHRDPGPIPIYTRQNGGYTLAIEAGHEIISPPPLDIGENPTPSKTVYLGYPYGSIPRLVLAWLTAEAVRNKSRVIPLGDSLADFLRKLELEKGGGPRGNSTRVLDQMKRLFAARLTVHYSGPDRKIRNHFALVDTEILFWEKERPDRQGQYAKVVLSEPFFQEIVERPVPLDLRVLYALRESSLAMDIYSWLTYRMSYLKKSTLIPWASLQLQFGADYARTRAFKAKFLEHLREVRVLYSHARLSTEDHRGLLIHPSYPQVAKRPRKPKTPSA